MNRREFMMLGAASAVLPGLANGTAATKRNAAEEISPGSTPFSGLNVLKGSKAPNDFKDLKGWTRVVRPSSSIRAPIARNMRVVWSRTGPGTRKVLTPSAPSAAS